MLEDDLDEDDGGDGDEEDSIEREIEENDLVDEVGSGNSRLTMFCRKKRDQVLVVCVQENFRNGLPN